MKGQTLPEWFRAHPEAAKAISLTVLLISWLIALLAWALNAATAALVGTVIAYLIYRTARNGGDH